MKQNFTVIAETRADEGKGASRRLRREGKVPAVLYGGKDKAQSIAVSHNEMWKSLKVEAFYSHILTLTLDGQSQQVVLKALQRHPVDETLIHIDFQRILADQILRRAVPLHFKGADVAPGVKIGGGIVEHHLNQVDVECLPKDLPEFLEIDLSGLELNDVVHLSQIKLPEGVSLAELKHGNDQSVVVIHLPRAAKEEEVAAAPAAAEVPAANQKAPDAKAAAAAPKAAAPKKK
ncbi:50S ribosomal protein L25 [Solimonas fluminis]|uniref:Large ribosomal subunit protein bL25 n=1 Tax=Solimonas fluminis TaxID=2086571 RepID=A0A2S5TES2_9GAMM|nr:50S ribosomal protein L25/general stress protein Ctc [Solimonas fluminis]PPE73479.1 50S ribosomal protein L25 [Solimonas fluminis]